MATTQGTVDFILEQAAGAGDVSARKMFGEYAVYLNGVVVALVCDDTLFLKPTAAVQTWLGEVEQGAPYPGAKPHIVLDAAVIEDAALLSQLFKDTLRALPVKPKVKRPAKKAAKAKTARR